jgi:peptide/nickel transport system permease protein
MHRAFIRSRVARRAVRIGGTLLGVSVFVFVMLRAIPGNQITATLGTDVVALNPAQLESLRRYYGLDQPLIAQFFSWLGNVFTGNLGYSLRAQESVVDLTFRALPITVELAVLSIVIALLIGVPLGMFAASRPGSARDALGQLTSLAGLSLPVFLLGSVLLAVFASSLGFNPNGKSYATPFEDPLLNLQQMILPSVVLGFNIAAPILRTTRAAVLEVRSGDFIRTARAKGVPPRRLQVRHILRNALIPIVTMTSLQFGYLLGGVVVVENIFSLPGIGRQMLLGLQQKEYAVAQSTILVIAVLFVLVNLLTDLLYRVIDPRIRAA